MKYLLFIILLILLCRWQKLEAQVTADFTINYSSANCAPAVVSFANLSTGTAPLTYTWNFGQVAGSNSTQKNPSTSYLQCGTYNVTLKVTNGKGKLASITKPVTIFCNPKPNFTVNSATGCLPLAETFNSGISSAGSGVISSYQWDFGDGVGSTVATPSHTYSNQGCKSVTLIITNSDGCKGDTTFANLICPAQPPVADFTSSTPVGCAYPFTVNYTGNASGGNGPFTYQWTFQGGTPATSTQANPTVVYNKSGIFSTSLVVTNALGCKDTIVKKNYVSIATNVTDFTIDKTTVCSPGSVFASAINYQYATTLSWTCTGGSMSTTVDPENFVSFTAPGTYQLCLNMTFPGNCTASKCTTIVVNPTPTASFTASGNNVVCQPPLNVTYTNTSTGTGLTYQWLFPGGTPTGSTAQTPSIVNYSTCGNYNVTLIATNNQGCVDTATKISTININCPVASFIASAVKGCVPLDVTFNSSQSSGSPVQWNWNFGDAANPNIVQSTQQNPEHTYTAAGTYNVRLIIVNALGCRDTILMKNYINLGTPAVNSFTATPTVACAITPIKFTNTSTGLTKNSTYSWDFVKAPPFTTMSTAQNPTYTYNDTGTFDISLITCDFGCCDTLIIPKMITIHPPIAVITLTNSCTNTHTVTLHGGKSLGADTYAWSIPGAVPDTSVDSTVIAYFPNTGDYIATLTVYNNSTQCSYVSTQAIHIRDVKADFYSVDSTGCSPHTFCFVNTSQDASTYAFNFMNSAGKSVYGTTNANPCLSFTTPGVYSVTLSAIDINGCTNLITEDSLFYVYGVSVNFLSGARQGCVPLTVNFTGSAKASNVSHPVSYHWDFGDPSSGALNSDTVLVASHTYNKSGIYTVTLSVTDNHGCVSVFSQPDYVQAAKPVVIFSTPDTISCLGNPICFTDSSYSATNLTSYTWDFGDNSTLGTSAYPCHNYNDTGRYNITLYVSDGWNCKDTLEKPLYVKVINPQANFTADTTFVTCPPLAVQFKNLSTQTDSKTKYQWEFGDGTGSTVVNPFHIYTKAGNFDVRLIITTSTGCVDTLLIPEYIKVKGPVATVITSATKGCPPQIVCFHAVAKSSMVYTWNTGDGTVINTQDSACYTYSQVGTYLPNVILSDSGCTYAYQIDTITITAINAGFKEDKPYICQYGSVQFTDTSTSGAAITTYQWNFGDTTSGAANTTTLQNPSHLFGSEGNYVVALTVTNIYGCTSTAYDTIHVTPTPTVLFEISTPVCPGMPVQFKDSTHSLAPVSYYNWNFGDPASGSNNFSSTQNPSHVYSTAGTYNISLLVKAVSGCVDSNHSKLTIHPSPNVNAGPAQTICFGQSAQLNASGASEYFWRPDATLSDTTISNPMAKPVLDRTYYLKGEDPYGCWNSDSVAVTVLQPFKMTLTRGADLCAGQSIQLDASGAVSYQWEPTTGLDNPYVADPYASPVSNITYTVIGYDGQCFHDIDTVSITVHKDPAVYAGQLQVILSGQSANIGMPGDSMGYSWSPATGLDCSSCSSTVAHPLVTTTYVLTVTNRYGCRSQDSVVIMVGCSDGVMFVPNAFSPNGNGIDDVFRITSQGLAKLNSLRIFDRWGELVYESDDLTAGWDGTYKGKPVMPGVYVYYLQVTCTNGQTIDKQGNITLLR